MKPCDIPVEDLIPHTDNMVLIDQLMESDDLSATALVQVKNIGLFSGPENQIPAWVGIEYMAQTIAAWSGFTAVKNNKAVTLGFLVGSRKYSSNVAYFPVGEKLTINVQLIFQGANGLASFQCTIRSEDTLVEAYLNVYQSDENIIYKKEEHL